MHYLLFYDVVPDYATKRQPFRAAHLDHAWRAVQRGQLLLGGALAEPVDGAVLLFSGSSPGEAEEFARTDPYVLNGLVTRWRVRTWTTVVGFSAAQLVHPHERPPRTAPPSTCGQGLAANAAVPAKLGELLATTADVLERHVKALDLNDANTRGESEAYANLARRHRNVAAELHKLADEMLGYRDLPMGRHDERAMTEAGGQMEAFGRLLAVERDLAALLEKRAADRDAMK